MIRRYTARSSPQESLLLYRRMLRSGAPADAIATTSALKCCARIRSLPCGQQLHQRITRHGMHRDSLLTTALMGLYAACGQGSDARKVFDEMPVRDTVAWNVLISSYARCGCTRDALGLFDEMRRAPHCLRPDDVTCLLVIRACAHLGSLEFGERIHRYLDAHGFSGNLNIRNALVAMYSKCGAVEKAFGVFDSTREKNVVGWSAMISGLAMNGYCRDALATFREMRISGVAPDEKTFTGVLSACSHGGFVDEGMYVFHMMRTKHGLTPSIHHYGCIADLLGRAGLLQEAYGFITNEMAVKPDAKIWRTLLGACKVHRNFELGERVIEHLIELKAHEAGDYVLLLNIYASVGNWEKVAAIREMMELKGIQTSPGCCTMELHGTVHEFVASDFAHPRKTEIYAMLDEIDKQLTIAGYVKNVEAELRESDLGEKEVALSYHSEKLAIAFGVLATPPGTVIRIAKNARICEDCHTFSKVFSHVYDRFLIIRDESRFHHFRQGRCSCNDYW